MARYRDVSERIKDYRPVEVRMPPEELAANLRRCQDCGSLPGDAVEITHVSLNDDLLEGWRCREVPAFSVQFHAEAAPGPFGALGLFAEFRDLIASAVRS